MRRLALAALLLTGCATVWHPPAPRPVERACYAATHTVFHSGPGLGDVALGAVIDALQDRAMRRCMAAQGHAYGGLSWYWERPR